MKNTNKLNKKYLILFLLIAIVIVAVAFFSCKTKYSLKNKIEESSRVYIIADDVEKEVTDKSDIQNLKEIFSYLDFEENGNGQSCPVSTHNAVRFESSKGENIVIYPSTDDCPHYEYNGNSYTTASILKDNFKTIARKYGMRFIDDY